MSANAVNLMSFDRDRLEAFFSDLGEPRFRAGQVLQWIYQRQMLDIDRMTDLSKSLRQRLGQTAGIELPTIARQQTAADGTCKWLLQLADGNCIETVYIPEPARGSLCVSSQVGCMLNCTFCATARQGYNRNLQVAEIIGQLWLANQAIERLAAQQPETVETDAVNGGDRQRRPVTNIVMMGMGEPMLNLDNVIPAMRLMMDDFSFGLSKRRVTLSTAGVVPGIDRLAEECPVSLAVSLHAPDDELRDQLVPLNKKYPLRVLLEACRRYVGRRANQRVTFEYVMLDSVNDSASQAHQLVRLLADLPAKVNLIPFNPCHGIGYRCSTRENIDRFRDILLQGDIFTVTRKTRGEDIDAACGQLVGRVEDRTKRSARLRS